MLEDMIKIKIIGKIIPDKKLGNRIVYFKSRKKGDLIKKRGTELTQDKSLGAKTNSTTRCY